jgi:hypothetical protein
MLRLTMEAAKKVAEVQPSYLQPPRAGKHAQKWLGSRSRKALSAIQAKRDAAAGVVVNQDAGIEERFIARNARDGAEILAALGMTV